MSEFKWNDTKDEPLGDWLAARTLTEAFSGPFELHAGYEDLKLFKIRLSNGVLIVAGNIGKTGTYRTTTETTLVILGMT